MILDLKSNFVLLENIYSSLRQAEFIINFILSLSFGNLHLIQIHVCEVWGRVSLICKWKWHIIFHNQHNLQQLPFVFSDVAKKKKGFCSYVRWNYFSISKLYTVNILLSSPYAKKKKWNYKVSISFRNLKGLWEKLRQLYKQGLRWVGGRLKGDVSFLEEHKNIFRKKSTR